MTFVIRSYLLCFAACVMCCIIGCSGSSNSIGDVVRFEIVDIEGTWVGSSDTTVVSGDATTENLAFLNNLRDAALNSFPDGRWVNYGPDASYRMLRIVCENGEIKLDTWHTGAEQNPGAVAASYGLTSLEGRSRDEFLRNDNSEYVAKRETFDDIEQRLIEKFKQQ